jgi:hypothetical protein
VWATNLNSSTTSGWFVRLPDVTPSSGAYTLSLKPGFAYSLTTTTGQGKGSATSPAAHGLALPYSDSFDGYDLNTEARYVADMQGAFEVRTCADGHTGRCLQQVAPVKPIEWQGDSDSYALLGDTGWSNYSVSLDVDLRQTGTVELLGRAGTQARPQSKQSGYYFQLADTGVWSLSTRDTSATVTTLRSGTITAPGTGTWHTMTLSFSGSTIVAQMDGKTLATVTDTTYTKGQVGFGVVGYRTEQLDNLAVTPPPEPVGTRYEAEDATCQGTVDSDHTGFSGTGFCNTTNAVGAYVEWTVNAASAGSVTLTFRYTNSSTADRPADLTVNGAAVGSVSFPPTGSWDTWADATAAATLNAGSNTVRVAATTSAGAPNLDYLEVTA